MDGKPQINIADGRPTKTMTALQFMEVDVVLPVPSPGQKCELCGRKVPKARRR